MPTVMIERVNLFGRPGQGNRIQSMQRELKH